MPLAFGLSQNYPNPFNPATTIRFALPCAAHVDLVVYDVLGREVAVLARGLYEAGYHGLRWDASDQASGLYLARLSARDQSGHELFTQTVKLLLAR